jgi:hypothetical protein
MTPPDPSSPCPLLSERGARSDPASNVTGCIDTCGRGDLPACPSDVLLESIVAFLAPLFVGSTTEPDLARLAAIETFASYQARTQAELVSIAQIIGLGLAAVDNLRLAMLPDLSLAMKLKLRASANALNRSARQTLHALEGRRRGSRPVRPGLASGPGEPAVGPAGVPHEATEAMVKAAVARAEAGVTEVRPSAPVADRSAVAQSAVAQPVAAAPAVVPPPMPNAGQPASVTPGSIQRGPIQSAYTQPAAAVASRAVSSSGEQVGSLVWADAMTKVASEFAGRGGSALARPLSKSDLMWADTLANVALRLTDGHGGAPGGIEAGPPTRDVRNESERAIHRLGA